MCEILNLYFAGSNLRHSRIFTNSRLFLIFLIALLFVFWLVFAKRSFASVLKNGIIVQKFYKTKLSFEVSFGASFAIMVF